MENYKVAITFTQTINRIVTASSQEEAERQGNLIAEAFCEDNSQGITIVVTPVNKQ